eukprot:c12557_g2_i3.p1 GENE.c12557_g2_i3~~c12557_g2_i3.p1  ORF type:complete len:762 (+),score=160.31 c12557_g2_i3:145-2286(+)
MDLDLSSDDEDGDIVEDWLTTPVDETTQQDVKVAAPAPLTDKDVVRNCQFFTQFPDALFDNIFLILTPHNFADGDTIVQQGQEGDSLWVLVEGTARVLHIMNNESRIVTTLYKGKFFGELALLYGGKRTATVRALGPTRCFELCKEDFERFPEIRSFLVIQQLPLLSGLSPEEQTVMVNALRPRDFTKNQTVMGKTVTSKAKLRRENTDTSDTESLVSSTSSLTLDVSLAQSSSDDMLPEPIGLLVITKGHAKVIDEKGKRLVRLYEGHTFSQFDGEYGSLVVTSESMKCMTICCEDFESCVPQSIKESFVVNSEKLKRVGTRQRLAMKTVSISVMESDKHNVAKTSQLNKTAVDGGVMINDYHVIRELGKGTYGKVYKCAKKDGGAGEFGQVVAVKVVKRAMMKKGQRLFCKSIVDPEEEVMREVNIMKELQHDNIVRLYEVIDDKSRDEIVLVMENVDGGDVMSQLPISDNEQARRLFRGLVRGIEYLHARNFIHCDIKPANMLMTSTGEVKICDFGISRIFSDQMASDRPLGTPAFMAPELLAVGVPQVTFACDVWGLGASLYMCVVGTPPWVADNEFELMQSLQHDELVFPPHLSIDPRLQNLISCMLVKDADLRITLHEVMEHEWVTNDGAEPMPRMRYRKSTVQTIPATVRQAANSSSGSGSQPPATPPVAQFSPQLERVSSSTGRNSGRKSVRICSLSSLGGVQEE